MLGVPEIALGVFPPAAAALLPLRIGASRAASAVLTGQARPADKWIERRARRADGAGRQSSRRRWTTGSTPTWHRDRLPRCAARCTAIRLSTLQALEAVLPEARALLPRHAHAHQDAVEGIAAFLEKRQPVWSHS